jgi:hypothetical protein
MRKGCSVLLAIGFGVSISAVAMTASVAGTVTSPQGQSITAVHVIVQDASGHVIGQGSLGSTGIKFLVCNRTNTASRLIRGHPD